MMISMKTKPGSDNEEAVFIVEVGRVNDSPAFEIMPRFFMDYMISRTAFT